MMNNGIFLTKPTSETGLSYLNNALESFRDNKFSEAKKVLLRGLISVSMTGNNEAMAEEFEQVKNDVIQAARQSGDNKEMLNCQVLLLELDNYLLH